MKKLYAVLPAVAILFAACTHDASPDVAGKGGNATLNIFPQHHGVAMNLDSCKVYVKYNTHDAPANGVYDDSVTCVRNSNVVVGLFSGLKNGKYYFYGTGYDHSISQGVKGGLPYTITLQQSQDFNLPVSEN